MSKKCYAFRRIEFETASALHAGNGESDPVQDMPVQVDQNGLPMIKATSIAGVLRHLYTGNVDDLFGATGTDGCGSRIFVENAVVCDEKNCPVEGLQVKLSEYLERIKHLRLRDHCRLDHRGVAEKTGKFDRTVLIAGVRFVTEISVLADSTEVAKKDIDSIMELWYSPLFRLGGGSRNGFGKIKVRKITGKEYDLSVENERKAFLGRSASLADNANEPEISINVTADRTRGKFYRLELMPENFWMVASGHGMDDIDIYPKFEQRIIWDDSDNPVFGEFPLLPATSIKGALAHRVAYHYNRLTGKFADQMTPEELKDFAKRENPAVRMLFGSKKDKDAPGSAGRVIISDIYGENCGAKVFNHVKIDRFTGGAFDGALFFEKVFYGGNLILEICVDPVEDETVMKAFDLAVEEIGNGMLPLGGGTMRGYGAMKAKTIGKTEI